jgi:hypothetical protein
MVAWVSTIKKATTAKVVSNAHEWISGIDIWTLVGMMELQMDLVPQCRLIADYYQQRYPLQGWIYEHVLKILKAWHTYRNKVCHNNGFFDNVCHEAVEARCKYIVDFLDDFVQYMEPPRLEQNASSAYDEASLRGY